MEIVIFRQLKCLLWLCPALQTIVNVRKRP